uniref:Alternative protein ABCA1 n=1 Tax=Homo sapiens TaxID=9606 RepID=L8E884_HUMAN|nr:alternative protein ABCA1 [Homo sapiens]
MNNMNAIFQIKPCPLQEHFLGFRGLSVMPTTPVSVTRLLGRLPELLETLTNPLWLACSQMLGGFFYTARKTPA